METPVFGWLHDKEFRRRFPTCSHFWGFWYASLGSQHTLCQRTRFGDTWRTFGLDLDRASGRAREIFKGLDARDHDLEPHGRVNGLLSPEERRAKKEEAGIMRWDWREFG